MIRLVQMVATSSALAMGILGLIYFPELKESFTEENKAALAEENDYTLANQLLDLKRTKDAASLIKTYKSQIDSDSAQGRKWLDLLVRTSEELPDTEQLVLIYKHNPEALKGHEFGAIKVASYFIAEKDWQNYENLKKLFATNQKWPAEWFLLDADSLILQNKSQEALTLLQTRYFEGDDETSRLLRLSLLQINDHPKLAWEPLQQAFLKNSNHPDLRYFRARFLETSGKDLLAQAEYYSLGKEQEKNSFLDSEITDFYLRQNNYKLALQSLTKKLNEGAGPNLWIKGIFLSKMYEPVPFNFQTGHSSKESAFLNYLVQLPENQFWDSALFSKVPNHDQILATYEESYWLRVLENLQLGRERDALTLLENPPLVLNDKDLASHLKTLISYRLTGEFYLPEKTKNKNLSQFFAAVQDTKDNNSKHRFEVPLSAAQFFKGPDAIQALLLAKGWNEAALKISELASLQNETPSWVTTLKARAYRENRGLKEALAFLTLQPLSANVHLVQAELLLQNDDTSKALAELDKASTDNSDAGKKATWLASRLLYDKGLYHEMRTKLQEQPLVYKSVKGQELLARAYLKEGKTKEAAEIYTAIEKNSKEAQSYLAKEAFQEKDFRRAFNLTKGLLADNPENTLLKNNLDQILKAMQD